jgi:galactokinase
MRGTVSACASGRVELLGNHTDYNEGVVLGAAINRMICVSGVKTIGLFGSRLPTLVR